MKGLLEVFILASLDSAPKHGYALLKEMEDAFGLEPNRNRIYPLLQAMAKDQLVEKRPDPEDDGRGRMMYALTEAGRDALDEYRRLPRPFHETVRRVWGGGAASAAREPPARDPEGDAPADGEGAEATPPADAEGAHEAPDAAPEAPSVSLTPQPPDAPRAPYPCSDARVGLEKDPATGNLDLKLRGCPMGAYDYCPLCPVYKSVTGLRSLVFGVR